MVCVCVVEMNGCVLCGSGSMFRCTPLLVSTLMTGGDTPLLVSTLVTGGDTPLLV